MLTVEGLRSRYGLNLLGVAQLLDNKDPMRLVHRKPIRSEPRRHLVFDIEIGHPLDLGRIFHRETEVSVSHLLGRDPMILPAGLENLATRSERHGLVTPRRPLDLCGPSRPEDIKYLLRSLFSQSHHKPLSFDESQS